MPHEAIGVAVETLGRLHAQLAEQGADLLLLGGRKQAVGAMAEARRHQRIIEMCHCIHRFNI